MAGASGDAIVRRYRRRVAANAKRLTKAKTVRKRLLLVLLQADGVAPISFEYGRMQRDFLWDRRFALQVRG